MATYTEIFSLRNDSSLKNKVAVAVVVKAQAYIAGASPTANQLNWAHMALKNPLEVAEYLLSYVLAANKAATTQQIIDATDSSIQTQVNTAVDALVSGGVI